ncbi:hypothetical protein KSH_01110 [Moraxella osloensis]|nr:DUF3987 domain-containing protein [Moraxella osloensis]ATQ84523.1 hypothetical protein KSH_01110 [Moraxella osloensis]
MNNSAPSKNTNKAFHEFIKGQPTASYETYQHNPALVNLAHCIGKDKLLFIDCNYTVDNTNQPTANSIGVMLFDEHYQPSNLAIFPLDNREPFPLHGLENDCFILGNGGQVVAVANIDTAIELYPYLTINGEYSIIAPLKDWQFERMVKAHASHSQVTLFTDYPTGKQLETTFKGYNVRLVATVDTITDLVISYSLDEIINDPNKEPALQTKVKELNGIEWGEPEPLRQKVIFKNPYPLGAFNGVLGEAVQAIAYYAQVPLSIAGQAVLGALSTLGQGYVNAPMGYEHKPASLFLLTEAESTAGKTQASRLAYYAIHQHEKMQYKAFIEAIDEWQTQKDSLKGKERAEFIASEPQPQNPNTTVRDITIEALLDKFIIGDCKNLSLSSDEAGQFFGGHTMKSDTVSNALSSLTTLWSDGRANRERSIKSQYGTPKTTAYDVRLTIDLAGQRAIIEPALNDSLMNGQGFLARFLISCEPSLIGERDWNSEQRLNANPYTDQRLITFWQRCNCLLDPLPTERLDERFNLPFGNGAKKLLADYQQSVEHRQKQGKQLEYLRAFAGRMAENATRIATLFAYFDNQKALNVEYLERAFLLVEYSINERLRYAEIQTQDKNDTEKLIEWIISKATGKNPPMLNKSFISQNAPTALRGKKLDGLLWDLESMGYLRIEQQERKKLVFINPILFK